MNYFEHHIGDYDKNTAHLSACEDGIYHRMLRRYYDKERPLPADVNEVKRIVRARLPAEKKAVDDVLAEFFHLEADGWHQDVCDVAIANYLAGEPEREVKKANEDNRLRRHREERSRLFKVITDAGEHAPWNTPMADLRQLVERLTGTPPETPNPRSPETRPETAPATPATATQTPITNHQSPVLEQKETRKRAPARPDGVTEQVWNDWLQLRRTKKAAVTETVLREATREAGKAGLSLDRFLATWCVRGSQGLQADWLKPSERGNVAPSAEPEWRREQRDRMQQAAPYAVARPQVRRHFNPDDESFDVPPITRTTP